MRTQRAVVVNTPGRTGSSFLCELYARNGYVRVNNPAHNTGDVYPAGRNYFQKDINGVSRVVGSVVFHSHIPDWLPSVPDERILVVLSRRKDQLKRALSWLLAHYLETVVDPELQKAMNGVYNPNPRWSGTVSVPKLTVTPEQVLDEIQRCRSEEQVAEQTVQDAGIEHIVVYHENLFADTAEIARGLGLSWSGFSWHQRSRFQAQDLIENYEELLKIDWRRQLCV